MPVSFFFVVVPEDDTLLIYWLCLHIFPPFLFLVYVTLLTLEIKLQSIPPRLLIYSYGLK